MKEKWWLKQVTVKHTCNTSGQKTETERSQVLAHDGSFESHQPEIYNETYLKQTNKKDTLHYHL